MEKVNFIKEYQREQMRPDRLQLSKTFFSLILLIIIGLPFVVMFSPENNYNRIEIDTVNDSVSSSLPKDIRQSISSEEENIDSFDVNPKSGRWDVTETGVTDDRIIDGNLRLITTENETDSSSEYFMQRGLQKTDAKIDYRYKALMDNSSQYFRDVLGDSADFEEGDRESFTTNFFNPQSITIENGIISWSTNGDANRDGIKAIIPTTGEEVYYTLEFRAKVDVADTLIIGYDGSDFFDIEPIGTEWTVFIQDYSFFDTTDRVGFYLDDNGVNTIYIDYVKLIGDLDYATHVEGEIEDTWDWEDSQEYFFTEEGNVSDFNDGTTENWLAVSATELLNNLNNEYLNITSDGVPGGDL
ncbi:hypothetical protein LCGC14_2771100, partial [marine sediment metagenome]